MLGKTCFVLFFATLVAACATLTQKLSEEGKRSLSQDSSLLRIATNSEISSLDPHAQFIDTNLNINFQIFEALTQFGSNKELLPALAERWEMTSNPTVWKFTLRKNVRFHSGATFDKDDVLATLDRVFNYAGDKPSGYFSNVNKIDFVKTLELNKKNSEAHHLFIVTKDYYRFLPHNLASIVIMQRAEAEEAKKLGQAQNSKAVLVEFAKGRWADGTGPYRFKKWIPLQSGTEVGVARVELEKATHIRADQLVSWDRVHYIPFPDPAARVKAIKDGIVDVASAAPADTSDLSRLQVPGLRVIHIQLFQGHDDRETRIPEKPALSLHVPVKDQNGNSMKNPLVSLNFRQALAFSVDKKKLVQDVVEGQGKPTEQYMQPGQPGYLAGVLDSQYDLELARRKLALASKEPGLEFLADRELTFILNGPEGRYFKDKEVLQAVAQMWTQALTFQDGEKRFSIRFETKTEPMGIYTGNARWYLLSLLGGGVDNGQGEAALRLYLTPNSSLNYAAFSDPSINQLYADGSKNLSPNAGDALYEKALRAAFFEKQAMIPLFNTLEAWIMREGICFEPRKDGLTLAKAMTEKSDCQYTK